MQSKRKKPILTVVIVLAAAVIAAAMLHEPRLAQTPVEQVLDAGSFKE